MPTTNDIELLREYVASDSQDAFEALLRQHVNLVYSTALRMVRDPVLANEVTQTTFIILAKKARTLGPGTILSGWLYRTTQFAAARALRTESRRRERENEAAQMHIDQNDSVWEELSPVLDQAMAQLGEADRNAVVLRYFENKSSRDVGTALGLNEATAQKRVARAVEKLRALCTKRGVVASAIAFTALISANAVQAAPPTVVSTTALAMKGTGIAASTSVLVKGTIEVMRWAKLKLAMTAGLGAVAVAGVVLLVEQPHWSQPSAEGRKLDSWLTQVDDGSRSRGLQLAWEPWQAPQQRPAQQEKAIQVIHAMGDKALPFLEADLKAEDSKLNWMKEKVGVATPLAARHRSAMLALEALGPEAKPLIPDLTKCLYGSDCPKEAAQVLAAIGPEGWEILTKAIPSTNGTAAACSVWALGTHRAAVPGTVDALKFAFTNGTSLILDAQAAWALARIGQDKNELVPLFINGLKANRNDLRWACALSLGELKADAVSAVPALIGALNDSDPKVQHDAAQALQMIDPAAAAQAGAPNALATPHVPVTRF